MEAGQIVHDGRLNELDNWRRRDEPRIAELVSAATIATEVRKALDERSTRAWSHWQRRGALAAGAVTVAGGIAGLVNALVTWLA